MGVMELEEGEAPFWYSKDDEDIDPDTDLSYIDKKIQDVLGQYQREFMGEVSADYLGARYGGYGSFLHAYRRSPSALSHPKNQSRLSSRSPLNVPLEATSLEAADTKYHSSKRISSSNNDATQTPSVPQKHEALPSMSVPGKTSPTGSLIKHRSSREYVANKKSSCQPRNGFVQNPLKFRVKVLSDIVLPRGNTEIYSSLGLDVSPSSSLKDNPLEANEASPNMQEPEASPSRIIGIMTTFAIPNGNLISPLHESLLNLVERYSNLEDGISGPHGVNGERKTRRKNNNLEVTETSFPSLSSGGAESPIKKEAVLNINLPELAFPVVQSSAGKHSCASRGEHDGYLEEFHLGAQNKKRARKYDSVSELEADLGDDGWTSGVGVSVQKEKASSLARSATEFVEMNEDTSTYSTKKLRRQEPIQQQKREDELDSSPFRDSYLNDQKNSSKKVPRTKTISFSQKSGDPEIDEVGKVILGMPAMKDRFSEPVESSTEKLDWQDVPFDNMVALSKGKQQSSSERKHSKKDRSDGKSASDLPRLSSRVSSSPAQSESTVFRIRLLSKSKGDAMGTKNSLHGPSGGGSRPLNGISKEEAGGSLQPEAAATGKDDWVECEECKKWRLLPDGLTVDLLGRWICSMLDWLPEMNSCDVSEEDTTNAVRLMYQLPAFATEEQINQPAGSKGGEPVTATVGTQHGDASGTFIYTDTDRAYSCESGNPNQGKVKGKPFQIEKKREADRDASGVQKKVKRAPQGFKMEQSPVSAVSRGSRGGRNRSATSPEVSKDFVLDGSSTSLKKVKDKGEETKNTMKRAVNDVSERKRKWRNEHGSQAVDNRAPGTRGSRASEYAAERNKKRSRTPDLRENDCFTPDAKDSNGCKDDAFEDSPLVQRHVSSVSQKSLQARKSSKRDPELGTPSAVTAVSSSSKPSSACNVEVKQHEVKSSPVLSVNFSPSKVSRDHDSNDSKVSDLLNEPDECFSVKRPNSAPEKNGSATPGTPCNSFKKSDHVGGKPLAKSVGGEVKQVASVKRESNNGIGKQQKNDIYKDAHRKSEPPFGEDTIVVSHQSLGPEDPRTRSWNTLEKLKLKTVATSSNRRGNSPWLSKCVSPSEKGDGRVTKANDDGDAKFTKQPGDGNSGQIVAVEHRCGDGNAAEDVQASSSLRKDSSQNPAFLLKEAQELKHSADRMKKILSPRETAEIAFQAILKFLIAASLVEPGQPEAARNATMISPSNVYKTTADLCNYYAREFESNNDMALAALAYKCMEVACMQFVYLNDVAAGKDKKDLQIALAPADDSPTSSVSDAENINHQSAAGSAKEPHVPVIGRIPPASAGANLSQLMNFTHEVHRAMDAIRRSQRAFSDAQSSLSKAGNVEGISSLKRALDFGFHDLCGFRLLVLLAMESLGVYAPELDDVSIQLDTAGAKLKAAILEREMDPQEPTLFVTLVLFMITRCLDHNSTCCEVCKVERALSLRYPFVK
ncbi:Cysteine-tryptophan domain-containing zinc finger protein 7-like protein [Drosera capensis]